MKFIITGIILISTFFIFISYSLVQGKDFNKIVMEMDLKKEQVDKIIEIKKKTDEIIKEKKEKLSLQMKRYKSIFKEDKFDNEKLEDIMNNICSIRREIIMARTNMILEFKDILTKVQWEVFKQYIYD